MKIWLTRHKRHFLAWGLAAVMGVVFSLGWHAGTAVAFPQKSESLPLRQKTPEP